MFDLRFLYRLFFGALWILAETYQINVVFHLYRFQTRDQIPSNVFWGVNASPRKIMSLFVLSSAVFGFMRRLDTRSWKLGLPKYLHDLHFYTPTYNLYTLSLLGWWLSAIDVMGFSVAIVCVETVPYLINSHGRYSDPIIKFSCYRFLFIVEDSRAITRSKSTVLKTP